MINIIFHSQINQSAMKLKQIAIAISLVLSSHLAIGATYDLPEEQESILPDTKLGSLPNDASDNGFFDLEFSNSETESNQFKQTYLEIIELLKIKQFEEAEKKINELIKQNPKKADAYILQAGLAFVQKQPEQAIKSYKKALQLDTNNIKAHLGLATAYLQTGNLKQAQQHAKKALTINDSLPHAYILLTEVAYQQKKMQEAENFLLTAQQKAQGNSEQEIMVANKLAKFYIIQKQPQKALTVAQDLISRYPENSAALALLATTQIYNNKLALAVPTLEKLIKQESNNIMHRLMLAKILAKQSGNEQQIIKLLDEISAIAPDNIQLQMQKVLLLTQIKRFPDALQATQKIRQLGPDTGIAEALQGEIYLAEKKYDLALKALQQSYAIKADEKVLNIISKIMIVQGKQTEAINFLSQELKKNPKNASAHFMLANIYQQQNNIREAEKHYQTLLTEYPDNTVILNNLAWIYNQENNPKALSFAEKAYQQAPESAAVADTYAVILVKQGELKKGIQIFEKASKLAPQSYDIQYHLAEAYALNGQQQQAKKILTTITAAELKYPEKEAAIKLLKSLQ